MDENFQQQIEARLSELPEDVQTAIASSDFDEKLVGIGKSHQLHVDQTQAVGDEAMLAMLGFIEMDALAKGLEAQAHLPADKAQAVADAIAREIFMPIRESMKRWAESRKTPAPPSPSPTPAPTATAKPAPPPDLMAAEAMLSEKKVAVPAPKAPVQPQNYKTDPYREPPE